MSTDRGSELALDGHALHGHEHSLISQVIDYAILRLDQYGVISSWNAGAERLKGYSSAEAIGRHFSMFYPEQDRRAGLPMELLATARHEGRVEHRGWRVRKDGSRFWGDVVITALHDELGGFSGYAKVTRDLTEQHELETSLKESEQRLRLLVSQVVDYAIIGLDPSGVIVSWNAGAQRLKGYSEGDALGRHFSIFYTAEELADGLPLDVMRTAKEHGRAEHTGWRVRQDGSRFWGDVVLTALHDESGVFTGYTKVTRDLTEQRRVQELQASLFATISHDLRAPIYNIGTYASLVVDAQPEERRRFAQRIRDNAEQLERLVTGMFDYSKLSAGSITVDMERVQVTKMMRTVLDDHERLTRGRDVSLHASDDVFVLADRAAMTRVLNNLLTNALKYSPDGSPIEIVCASTEARVFIEIIDHGRGIHPDDVPLLFTEFVRGRLAADDGGTGLGLASVKLLMNAQGGSVSLTSELGVGTKITLGLRSDTCDDDPQGIEAG